MSENRSKPDQYQLRFPEGMRDHLKAEADRNGRSMNAEIIARLEAWPKITLPRELVARIDQALSEAQKSELEYQLTMSVQRHLEKQFPGAVSPTEKLIAAFNELIEGSPADRRKDLRDRVVRLIREAAGEPNGGDPEIPF